MNNTKTNSQVNIGLNALCNNLNEICSYLGEIPLNFLNRNEFHYNRKLENLIPATFSYYLIAKSLFSY